MHYPTTSTTLLEKIQSGDEISWAIFAEKYRSLIFAIAKLYRLDDSDCQEVFQETMRKFFQGSTVFKYDPTIARFRTYFCKIVRAKIIDQLRRKTRNAAQFVQLDQTESIMDDTPAPDQAVDNAILEQWRHHVLQQCIESLKDRVEPDTFQIFELYVLQQRSPKEVAAFFQCTTPHVYAVKNRCLNILRTIYQNLEQQDPELGLSKHGL